MGEEFGLVDLELVLLVEIAQFAESHQESRDDEHDLDHRCHVEERLRLVTHFDYFRGVNRSEDGQCKKEDCQADEDHFD